MSEMENPLRTFSFSQDKVLWLNVMQLSFMTCAKEEENCYATLTSNQTIQHCFSLPFAQLPVQSVPIQFFNVTPPL
jgi:hypothetical protein